MPIAPDPRFTIVIPVTAINEYIREAVGHILQITDSDWDLIIVTNERATSEWPDSRIHLMASGRVGPGAKRDMAANVARGEFLVFLDDDSYPRRDVLSTALPHFADADVVAIGGPAITPPEDGFCQRVSGTVFLSRFSGGSPERYIPLGPVREVDDWPSVNFIVRTSTFLDVGGFDTSYWPGEDTKLCLDLIRTGKILYVPSLVAWHHRRRGLRSHFRQVGAYGLHRGFFAKRYPETSRKVAYFAPSTLVVFSLFSLVALVADTPHAVDIAFFVGWAAYAFALLRAFIDFVNHSGLPVACCSIVYTVGTHIVYGVQFIRGFVLEANLVSRLR